MKTNKTLNKTKKPIFVIQPHSMVDVITNSSSELFVFGGNTKDVIINMIKAVYKDYLEEYDELKSIQELSTEELDCYFQYYCSAHMWPAVKSDYPIMPGFTFEELYKEEDETPAWNGEIQYKLRENEKYRFVTDDNKKEIINKMSPNRDMYFLFSKDDNPDGEMQERLETVGKRFHLG